jgi:hypothetical protein
MNVRVDAIRWNLEEEHAERMAMRLSKGRVSTRPRAGQ